MESLLTIADNLEPLLRRINMQHRRKTKKLTLFNQIILRFKHEALCSVNNYKFTFTGIICNEDNNNNNKNNNNNNNNNETRIPFCPPLICACLRAEKRISINRTCGTQSAFFSALYLNSYLEYRA